jgi:hypothetical protein
VEMIAKFNPVITDQVQQIQKNPDNMPHYFGEKNQNEIILAVTRKIKERILEMLKFFKYYSVILAFTFDFSHQE